ncbi:MAG TPA: hypothetical protein PKE29_02320 [Phycisphaerales bacterium]|nr:hypothetical protein [Phycisphaerales bacterium]
MTTVTQIAHTKTHQARAEFIDAAWASEPADRLADMAVAAGLEPIEADAIIARIAEARGDVAAAEDAIQRRRAASKAKADCDATSARISAAIEKLEAEAEAAALEADTARRALHEAESAARRLLLAYDQGLLPAARLPKEVLSLIERRESERATAQAHAAMIAATNQRNRVRDDVERLDAQLRTLPMSPDRKLQESRLKEELERAKAALTAAETRLSDAEGAHARASKGL